MDIEHLKLILETLNNAGDGAFVLAIIWMVVRPIIIAIGFGGTIVFIVRTISASVLSTNESAKAMSILRSRLNIGSPGYLTDSEIARITRKVFELKEKEERGEL